MPVGPDDHEVHDGRLRVPGEDRDDALHVVGRGEEDIVAQRDDEVALGRRHARVSPRGAAIVGQVDEPHVGKKLTPGVMRVIMSHSFLVLSRKTLSLYSSLTVTLGVSVIGDFRGSCRPCGSVGGRKNCANAGCATVRTATAATIARGRALRRRTDTPRCLSQVGPPIKAFAAALSGYRAASARADSG